MLSSTWPYKLVKTWWHFEGLMFSSTWPCRFVKTSWHFHNACFNLRESKYYSVHVSIMKKVGGRKHYFRTYVSAIQNENDNCWLLPTGSLAYPVILFLAIFLSTPCSSLYHTRFSVHILRSHTNENFTKWVLCWQSKCLCWQRQGTRTSATLTRGFNTSTKALWKPIHGLPR